jgi:8-oxo-dGTP pyrophosphatase MutT (NUDIX family)
MTFREAQARLRDRLRADLPGLAAQLPLAPQPRPGWRAGHFPEDARPAAGLLCVFSRTDQPYVLLTVRSAGLPTHAAQVSLPGGRIEAGETIEEAALREAHEEIGLDPASVEILGQLTPLHIPVSGYTLHPVVGLATVVPRFKPAEREVERILEVPIADLHDATRLLRRTIKRDDLELDVPYFLLCGEQVWGATAMVLAEFRALFEDDLGI